MKDIQSVDNMKQAFDYICLPNIDIKNKVMEKIYERKEKCNNKRKKNLLVVILISALLIFTAGFAVLQVWNLEGPGGSGYNYELIDKGDMLPEEVYKAQFENLEPGKALAIMKTRDNPKKSIHLWTKPIRSQSMTELSNKVGSKFRSPTFLPQGFEFVEGGMDYKFSRSYRTKMIRESKNTDEEYIFKVLEPTNEIQDYHLVYRKNYDTIAIDVFFDYPIKTIQEVNSGHRVTKVNVNDFEAIYTEHDGIAEVTWLDDRNGDTTYYNIHSSTIDGNTMKNELIKMGESLK